MRRRKVRKGGAKGRKKGASKNGKIKDKEYDIGVPRAQQSLERVGPYTILRTINGGHTWAHLPNKAFV